MKIFVSDDLNYVMISWSGSCPLAVGNAPLSYLIRIIDLASPKDPPFIISTKSETGFNRSERIHVRMGMRYGVQISPNIAKPVYSDLVSLLNFRGCVDSSARQKKM